MTVGAGGDSRPLPAGDVCFLFTDVERSTEILRAVGDARWAEIRDRAHALITDAVQRHGGALVSIEGDGCFAAFPEAAAAAAACVQAQLSLRDTTWDDGIKLRVRMGLHSGTAITPRGGDYIALAVHRAARVCACAHGGQVLATATVAAEVPESFTDLGQYTVRDFDGPVRLYALAADGDARSQAPPRVPPAFDPQVPQYDTALVGRDGEIQHVLEQLRNTPVVTLTGAAGVGKTRLAVAVLSERSHGGRAWFVDLTAVAAASHLGDAVGRAVGCPPDLDVDAHLDAVLAGDVGLLVLDHCDDLRAEAAAVAELLRDWNPTLHILCTCREPVGVRSETVVSVTALEQPASAEPAAVLASGAGRLFLERAQRSEPAAEVPHTLAPEVVRICRATKGNALALELSAGLCVDETVHTVADLVETATSAAQLTRLVLDRAGADARRALAALAALAHPVPEGIAITAVAAAVHRDSRSATGVIENLVRRSLLSRAPEGYALLPPVRESVTAEADDDTRTAVLRSVLAACLSATASPPRLVTEHDPVGPVAAGLIRDAALPTPDRQRLAAQLAPWWAGRLGGRRARELLQEALALGRAGSATAALHLAIARTYAPGTETVETERHVHEAARLLGEADAVPQSLVERLRRTLTEQADGERP